MDIIHADHANANPSSSRPLLGEATRRSEMNQWTEVSQKKPNRQPLAAVTTQKEMSAEFLGTFFLTFLGNMCVGTSGVITSDALTTGRLLFIALGYGMTYGALMYALSFDIPELPRSGPSGSAGPNGPNGNKTAASSVSMRHLNPVLTLCLFLTRQITGMRAVLLWSVQLLATVLCVLLVPPCLPGGPIRPFERVADVSVSQSLTMSVVTSFISTLVILLTFFDTTSDIRGNQPVPGSEATYEATYDRQVAANEQQPFTVHESNSFICGLVVLVCVICGSAVSGGFMNPMMAISLSVLSSNTLLAPLVGPFLGGLVALLVKQCMTSQLTIPWGMKSHLFATHRQPRNAQDSFGVSQSSSLPKM